ncbi:hypothetical protein Tco_0667960 [Tanacetum coccineum]
MRGPRWDTITLGIGANLSKRYNDNKYNMKRDYWIVKGRAPAVDALRRQPRTYLVKNSLVYKGDPILSFGSTRSRRTKPLSMLRTGLETQSSSVMDPAHWPSLGINT